jgi:triacylglycerol esterase/lipase EstA (alpha/beta hydrolase family)
MTFSHDLGIYNIEASVNAWLAGQLTTATPLGGTVPVVIGWPHSPIAPPIFSIYHLGSEGSPSQFEGGNVGYEQRGSQRWGMAQIDCWESYKHENYAARLAQMGDLLTKAHATLYASGSSIPVYDFYSNASAPVALAYRIRIEDVQESPVAPDPNPDLVRRRFTFVYRWIERA